MACTVFKGSSWSKKLILLAVYQVIASNTSLYSLPIFSQPKLYNSRWSQNTFSYPATYTIQSVQRKCSTGYMLLFYLFYFIYVCCTCMGFFVRICFSSFFLFFFLRSICSVLDLLAPRLFSHSGRRDASISSIFRGCVSSCAILSAFWNFHEHVAEKLRRPNRFRWKWKSLKGLVRIFLRRRPSPAALRCL